MTAYTNGGNTRNRKLTRAERQAAMLRCHPELEGKSGEEIAAIFSKPENGGALRNSELEAIGKSIGDRYDATCGMQDKETWAKSFLYEVRAGYYLLESQRPAFSVMEKRAIGLEIARIMADDPIPDWASEPMPQLLQSKEPITVEHKIETHKPNSKPVAKPIPETLKQAKELVIEEKPAVIQAPVSPEELEKLIRDAIEHWDDREHRKLPNGYQIYPSPNRPLATDQGHEAPYIILRHPGNPSPLVVGMRNRQTGRPECCIEAGEITTFVGKVGAKGARPELDICKRLGILAPRPNYPKQFIREIDGVLVETL